VFLFNLYVVDKDTGLETSAGKIPALEDDIENCGTSCVSSFVNGMAFETPSTLTIALDIKPDSYPNSVNPYSRGVIPVAILGSDTFDVSTVDVTTLGFGPGGAAPAHNLADGFTYNDHLLDVNMDGYVDLVTHYRTRETGISCADETAQLAGETMDGQALEGSDSISTVGCRRCGQPSIWLKDEERPSQTGRGRVVDVE